MQTRREFLRRTALLTGAAGLSGVLPEAIQRAFAIEPAPGSSYLDAEHIVILMQENRSFDHTFGTLQGVRGFNDPRAITQPDGNVVWLQTNTAGETYAPFRLDMKDTQATWMGALPHSRESQVDAWNGGSYDRWLDAKRPRRPDYAAMPLTMGHYTREDLPFYYSLADAFTICDQNFSGVMTSTTPNRMMFWTGSVREEQHAGSKANLRNSDYTNGGAHWTTFPERLQEHGVSWKVYQNELTIVSLDGLTEEQDAWLSNFGGNPFEQFAQYNVSSAPHYLARLPGEIDKLSAEIAKLEAGALANASNGRVAKRMQAQLAEKKSVLAACRQDLAQNQGLLEKLPESAQALHRRAFCVNTGDPEQHALETISYMDGVTRRDLVVPKGDVLHQFREDVQGGKLPTVSWLVAPEKFSDHPSQPWFGAWYVSEVMDILTKNPEVWKKTIFILTYDENDGYFDHVPPFVAPDPRRKETGKVSPSLANDVEYAYREDELQQGVGKAEARTGPVGLGFRVPMIVASPWSRGGWVNSQVFDHSSTLLFLESFLKAKSNVSLRETNLSAWRRSISGDLTSVFRPFDGNKLPPLPFIQRDPFVESIHKAKFKEAPSNFRALGAAEIAGVNRDHQGAVQLANQEAGVRPSCGIPYELYGDGGLDPECTNFRLHLRSGNRFFGNRATGVPFNVYAYGLKESLGPEASPQGRLRHAAFAVAAGETLDESWMLAGFADGRYHLAAHGPNGFLREFQGTQDDPALRLGCEYEISGASAGPAGHLVLRFTNVAKSAYTVKVVDCAYGVAPMHHVIKPGSTAVSIKLAHSFGWYDFNVSVAGFDAFQRRIAGRVETGRPGYSDPFMGGSISKGVA